jgi:hypothetical protein
MSHVRLDYPIKDWGNVEKLNARHAINKYPDRILLMVWPSYEEPWSARAVEHYVRLGGQCLIHVGEGLSGGCTGCQELEEVVDKHFIQVDRWDIPQWECIHDYLQVFQRKEQP